MVLPFLWLYSWQPGLTRGSRPKLVQRTLEHRPAVLGLPEIDTQPYEPIDDFLVAGLHRSYKGAEGFILGFWQLRQDVSGDDLRGLN
jgi:hypothetical protein